MTKRHYRHRVGKCRLYIFVRNIAALVGKHQLIRKDAIKVAGMLYLCQAVVTGYAERGRYGGETHPFAPG
jgi:hypothetical protein